MARDAAFYSVLVVALILLLKSTFNWFSTGSPSITSSSWTLAALFLLCEGALLFLFILRSERRVMRYEREITDSEIRLQRMTKSLPVGVLAVRKRKCVYANPKAQWLTGLSKSELLEKDVLELFAEEDRPLAAQRLSSPTGDSTGATRDEVRLLSADKGQRWVDFSVVKIPSEKEQTVQLILNDQSERKRADLLRAALYRLSESAQSLDTLDDLFEAIHQTVSLLMKARNFYIALYDSERDEISFPYWVDEKDSRPPKSALFNGVTARVIRGDRSYALNYEDMEELRKSGEIESGGSTPSRFWMGVPLKVRGKVIGALCVQDYDGDAAYESEEMEALEILASQAALAIDRKRYQERENERLKRVSEKQRALSDIVAFSDEKLDSNLRVITEKTAETLHVSRVAVWLLDEQRKTVECGDVFDADSGEHEGGEEQRTNHLSAFLASLEDKQALGAEIASIDPISEELVSAGIQRRETTARLDAPLRQRGKIMGFLTCEHTGDRRDWEDDEVNFVASVANIAALAVSTAKQREVEGALRRRDALLVATAEISLNLLKGSDLEKSLGEVLSTIGNVLDVYSTHVFELVREKEKQKLTALLRSSWYLESNRLQSDFPVLSMNSQAEEAFLRELEELPHLVAAPASLPPPLASFVVAEEGRNVLILPLLTRGVCIGFLMLVDRKSRRNWQVDELSILKTCVNSIEGALRRRDAERVAREREERFRVLAETTSAAIVIYKGSQALYMNPAAMNILALPAEKWRNMDLLEVLAPEFRAEMARRREERMSGIAGKERLEFRIVNGEGKELWLSGKGAPILYEGERAAIMTAFDITDRKRIEEELRQQKSLFQQLFENSPEAITILDNDERIIKINKGFENLFGWRSDEVVGKNLNSIVVPAVDREAGAQLSQRVLHKKTIQAEKFRQRKDGSLVPVDIIGYPIFFEGDKVGVFGIYRDISKRKRVENRLYHKAHFDSLTGLPNRNSFMERMKEYLSDRADDKELALLYLDIDRFKEINDALGHEVGDQLLVKVSKRLLEEVPQGSFLARMGSDEFALVLIEKTNSDQVAQVAKTIVESFNEEPFMLAGQEMSLHISMGISLFPTDGVDTDSLLRNADIAAYRVKAEGGDGFLFFRSEMGTETSVRVALKGQLRRAIENREFHIFYQPVIQLADNRVVSSEGLIRWNHPRRGLVMPDDFIRVAEDSGLIVPIGEDVLNSVCVQNKRWQEHGLPPMVVSVNISSRQFRSGNVVEIVRQCLRETALAPSFLEIEITESTAMWDLEHTRKVLHELAELGVRIAIDDFGTGYSSFRYLKEFPIDTLKVDKTFIDDLLTDPKDASIVKAIVTMSHGMGLNVIAEGVETIGQYEFLRNAGCDAVQGFYFSPALPGQELELFLRSRITPTLGDQ